MKYQRTAFSHIDGLAHASLSREEFSRYVPYRDALMAKGESASRIVTMLGAFVWELYERGPGMTVH
jgi:hypothetical protein